MYAFYDGKIVSPRAIGHLRNHAIVHVVDKLTGGGKKKNQRKANQTQSDQSGSSSSEADMFCALMEKSCRTGEGWNDDLYQAMLKMDDDTIQRMMDKMRCILEVDTVRNPVPAFDSFKRKVQEYRQRARDQQEEAAQEGERWRKQEEPTRRINTRDRGLEETAENDEGKRTAGTGQIREGSWRERGDL